MTRGEWSIPCQACGRQVFLPRTTILQTTEPIQCSPCLSWLFAAFMGDRREVRRITQVAATYRGEVR